MENPVTAVPVTPVTDSQTFTKEQVDALLVQTRNEAETTIDGIRAAARAAVAAAKGQTSSFDSYVADASKLNAAEDVQRSALADSSVKAPLQKKLNN